MDNLAVYTTGDIKEARDRQIEAEARKFEATVKRFDGDKDAARKYLERKKARNGR
jgi:hypothetical protein